MTFTPPNTIDATATGDTVKDGIIKIDDNVTTAYEHLNTLNTAAAAKINRSDRNVPSGVCPLDSNTKVPVANIPTIPISKLEIDPRIPTGSVMYWPFGTPPAGFLVCNGAELPDTYTDLITVLTDQGSPYGSGSNGRPKIPDYRGYFLRAAGGAGVDPDYARSIGAVQAHAMLSHYHNFFISMSYAASGGAVLATTNVSSSGTATSTTYGSVYGTENRPVNKSIVCIIKYE